MNNPCPATRRYASPDSGDVIGLQCKFTAGHHGDHAADPGTGTGDVFWPQDDTDVIVRTGRAAEEEHIREMVDAAMKNPGRFVHGL